MRAAFPFNIGFLHQNYFFLLEKVKLKKHEFSHQWESLSHQARGQQFTAVQARPALSEMLLNHSFSCLLSGLLVVLVLQKWEESRNSCWDG